MSFIGLTLSQEGNKIELRRENFTRSQSDNEHKISEAFFGKNQKLKTIIFGFDEKIFFLSSFRL